MPGSPAHDAGVEPGDRLVSINGHRAGDLLDYLFHRSEPALGLKLLRRGKRLSIKLANAEGQEPGLELEHFKVRTCRNKCVFCFVSQLPKGLRKTLYMKDEDYRMSFLYGNYITLTNLGPEDKKRITRMRLSPLYVSVHSTGKALRRQILCNPGAPDIMKELRYLASHRIRVHTQVVLCPGLNDGAELKRTIRDLYSLYPYVASIAVVPVGLTQYSKAGLVPVGADDADRAIETVQAFQRRFRRKHGEALVYAADEMFIRAGRTIPRLSEYGDLEQLENGVGMVPAFTSRASRLKLDLPATRVRFLTFTGTSFYPYLRRFTERLGRMGARITLRAVTNTFFGDSVTVTGLLTGRDVLKSLSSEALAHDVLLVPDVVLKEGSDVFLDNVSLPDLHEALGLRCRAIRPTPDGLLKAIREESD